MSLAEVVVPPKFLDLLVSARDKKETGKVYAYYRDETSIHTGVLYFLKGTLAGCKFEQLKGVEAIKQLLHSAIASAMFVKVGKGDIEQQGSMPDIDALISTLRQEDGDQLAPWSLSGSELFQAIVTTLGDLLGDKGERNVEDIAVRYPPHEYPHQFVDECTKMLSNYMGAKRAREILASLVE